MTNAYKENAISKIEIKLKRLNDPNFIVDKVESSLKFPYQSIAIHHLSNRKKEINYRKLYFISGLMWHYINEKYNVQANGYWFPFEQVCYLIYSDNSQLIDLVNKSDSFPFNGEYLGNYFSQMLLAIATKNWNKLSDVYRLYMATFENSGSWFCEKDIYTDIFSAFIDRDIDKLSVQIKLLETPKIKKARIKEDTKEKYFSKYTTAFAKLAKMNDMEITIDSEYVPKHLLSYSPLEEYTIPYRFLRDWCREQGINWRYDPIHPELQDWDNDPENPNRDKGGFFKKLFS